jgi:hypothetical protein
MNSDSGSAGIEQQLDGPSVGPWAESMHCIEEILDLYVGYEYYAVLY